MPIDFDAIFSPSRPKGGGQPAATGNATAPTASIIDTNHCDIPPDTTSTTSTIDANPCGTSTYGVELSESPSSTLHPSSTHLNPDDISTYDDGGTSGTRKPPIPRDTGEAPEPGPAEAQAVEVNATAPVSDLPPGWPSNTPRPPWWGEFLSILGNIRLLQAREQMCGDETCQFPASVLWTDGQTTEWSCPKCGRTSDVR
jgi:hypothetical protein